MVDRARRRVRHMKTAWHPLLVVMLEHLLPRGWYQLLPEFQLTKEPQRIDTVIVRRRRRAGTPPEPEHLASVLEGLHEHNLVHLKGPTDELEWADATQLLGYALQYMTLAKVRDPEHIALRVLAPKLTPRFADQVTRLGGALARTSMLGVHEGTMGGFALRVVETAVAYPGEHEHLLYTLAPQYVDRPQDIPDLDADEQALFHFLSQCVEQFRKDPQWRTLMKDAAKVDRSYASAWDKIVQNLPLEERLRGLAPEQRLAGLAPEQRLAGLSEAEQVLALSDALLRLLPDDYIATLPDDVRAKVRERRIR